MNGISVSNIWFAIYSECFLRTFESQNIYPCASGSIYKIILLTGRQRRKTVTPESLYIWKWMNMDEYGKECWFFKDQNYVKLVFLHLMSTKTRNLIYGIFDYEYIHKCLSKYYLSLSQNISLHFCLSINQMGIVVFQSALVILY